MHTAHPQLVHRPLALLILGWLCFLITTATLHAVPQCPQDGTQPPAHKLLSVLAATQCTGVSGPMACSPDGSVLFASEGGSLGVIQDTSDQAQYDVFPKLVPIGKESLVPAAMA